MHIIEVLRAPSAATMQLNDGISDSDTILGGCGVGLLNLLLASSRPCLGIWKRRHCFFVFVFMHRISGYTLCMMWNCNPHHNIYSNQHQFPSSLLPKMQLSYRVHKKTFI